MSNFEKFLKDNKIQKQDIAEFLGVSKAFITQLSQGTRKLPSDKYDLIKANKAWDCSALDIKDNSGILINSSTISGDIHQDNRKYFSDSPDVLRSQIEQLERIIEEKEIRIAEKDKQIAEKDKQIAEKDKQIAALIHAISKQ